MFSGNDGYVAFQVEGNPAPTVEWFKVYSFKVSNTFGIIIFQIDL